MVIVHEDNGCYGLSENTPTINKKLLDFYHLKFKKTLKSNNIPYIITKEYIMTLKIDGKEYDESKFSPELQNYLTVRQEMQVSKTRHTLEIEKIDVLTAHYNKKIVELLKKEKIDK